MFSQPQIRELLDRYVRVELYTDKLPPTVKQPATTVQENKELLYGPFESGQLPLYAIVEPDPSLPQGYRIVAKYEEGKINDVDGFSDFLRKPLGGGVQVGMK